MIEFEFLKVSLQVEQFKYVDGSYPEPSSTSSSPRLGGSCTRVRLFGHIWYPWRRELTITRLHECAKERMIVILLTLGPVLIRVSVSCLGQVITVSLPGLQVPSRSLSLEVRGLILPRFNKPTQL